MRCACNCGAVRFEFKEQPTGVYICHCSICRRHTGTNGNAVLVIPNEEFSWLSGEDEIRTWEKPGHDWQIWWCKTCGSQLPGVNDASRMFIPAGLIDDDLDLEVIHHTWVDSKAHWDQIGDTGKLHTQDFAG